MTPLPVRLRALRLAPALDGRGLVAPDLHAEVRLAARLRAMAASPVGPHRPDPDFRSTLRRRVLALATTQAAELRRGTTTSRDTVAGRAPGSTGPVPGARAAVGGWSSAPRVQRALGLTAGALACLVAGTGVAVAGGRSLPGDPFYGAKRATEGLELRVTSGDAAKGALHFDFAATRLGEIRELTLGRQALAAGPAGLAQAGGTAFGASLSRRLGDTLREMDRQTRAGDELLTQVFRADGQLASLRVITEFSTAQGRQLQALLPSLPATSQDVAQASLGLVDRLGQAAALTMSSDHCRTCHPASPVTAPTPAPTAPAPTAAAGTASPVVSATPVRCACALSTPQPQPQPTRSRPSGPPTGAPDQPAGGSPQPTAGPTPSSSEPHPSPTPSPAPAPAPSPTAPAPSPSPTGPLPVPVPLPPLPVPTGLPVLLPSRQLVH